VNLWLHGARLESDFGEAHRTILKDFLAQSVQRFPPHSTSRCEPVNVAVSQRLPGDLTQFSTQLLPLELDPVSGHASERSAASHVS
jgi:hypothetical protein